MEKRYVEPLFFVAVLIGTMVVVFLLFRPFLYTLILAGILAYLTSGIFGRLLRLMRSPSGSALIMTIAVFVIVLVPLTLIGLRIVQEAAGLYVRLSSATTQMRLTGFVTDVQGWLDGSLPGVAVDAQRMTAWLSSVLNWIVGSFGALLGSFVSLLLNFFLLLLFYFYLVRDGSRLLGRFKELSPFSDAREDQVFSHIGLAITASVRGSLVMAVLQALVSGIGFVIFGLPNPALWGSVVFFAAFIPTIGTALVQIPAVFYLALTGHIPQAFALALWATTAVGMLDNILGPKLVAHGMRMHPLITLLAVLGGLRFYGPIGLLLGPITVSLLYALLDIYLSVVHRSVASWHHPSGRFARGV